MLRLTYESKRWLVLEELAPSNAAEAAPMKRTRLSITLVLLSAWLVGADPLRAQSGDDVTVHPAFYAADAQLGAYITDALRQNPAIREAAARYRAALQLVPQVRELPDPMVTFTQALRSVETRVGPQRQTVMLSQTFPWFGTLALREQVAVQAAAAQYHRYVVRQTVPIYISYEFG